MAYGLSKRKHTTLLFYTLVSTCVFVLYHLRNMALINYNYDTNCVLPGMKVVYVRNKAGSALFPMAVYEMSSQSSSNEIASKGYWEIQDPQEIVNLAPLHAGSPVALQKEQGSFLDVGAENGYYSLLFAHAGFSVTAIEPMPRNLALIKASICLNPTFKIKLLEVGLSDRKATCRFALRKGLLQKPRSKMECPKAEEPLKACSRGFKCFNVPVTTMDILYRQNKLPDKVGLLRMNTGAQRLILSGAQSYLKRVPPHVVQFKVKWAEERRTIKEYEEIGYRISHKRGPNGNIVGRYLPKRGVVALKAQQKRRI